MSAGRLHPIAVLTEHRAAVRAALKPLPAELRRAAWSVLEDAKRRYASRVAGAAKARAARSAKRDAWIIAHLWKTPVTAPDLVERVQQHCATAGVVAPDARVIRAWRDRQIALISERQHNGSQGEHADCSTRQARSNDGES